METEQKTEKIKAPAPSAFAKSNWWWGIFLAASLPYGMVLLSPLFPIGLGSVYCWICVWIFSFFPGLDPIDVRNVIVLPAIVLGYATYMVHYILTLQAKTMRVFMLLMLSLGLLVCANLVGCAKEDAALPAFQN